VEVAVVLVIIGLLTVIATPTLLGSRHTASDRAAQAMLHHGLLAEHVAYAQHEAYTADLGSDGLPAIESSLRYADDVNPATIGTVYVDVSAGNVVTLGSWSTSGSCFYLQEASGGGTVGYLTDPACPRPSQATGFGRAW